MGGHQKEKNGIEIASPQTEKLHEKMLEDSHFLTNFFPLVDFGSSALSDDTEGPFLTV